MLNTICIIGRVCNEPELRHTDSGTAVTSFTVAVERDYKDADGGKQTDFISCIAWRNNAEFFCRYFQKGSAVCVQGSLQSRKYETKDGEKRTVWEVLAEHIYFAGSKPQQQPNAPTAMMQELDESAEDSGDLPF